MELSKKAIFIQVIIGLVLASILYTMTLFFLKIPSIVIDKSDVVKKKESTLILDGYAPATFLSNTKYNTMNINSSNFRKIGRSVNTAGGLQFTYQFWIKISADTTANDIKDRIILHRGSQQKFSSGIYKYDPASKTYNKIEEKPGDIVIKCPLIKFGQSKDEIEVKALTGCRYLICSGRDFPAG